jgi:hypothetical protein
MVKLCHTDSNGRIPFAQLERIAGLSLTRGRESGGRGRPW